jgi:dTDP-4-amino-4,6-dideoxygalactose transaminase
MRDEILAEITAVCDSQAFILGPKVAELEEQIAALCGGWAVGVSSGTDAQLLIMMAMGIGPGDAVITSPFTFFSTAGCISRLGAKPIFVDIEPDSFNLDPVKLEEFLACSCIRTPKGLVTQQGLLIRAVLPVHLFGLCCDMDRINEVCAACEIPVIEDAAQAIGAEYPSRTGVKRAGGLGQFSFFSFYPTKNLGAFGDAGVAVAADRTAAGKMKTLRNHGMEPRYVHEFIGGNFRLDALQAAVLLKKLPWLERWSRRRWDIAQRYRELLSGVLGDLTLPAEPYRTTCEAGGHIFHQFVIRTGQRDATRGYLRDHGIGSEVYYPVPLHQQKCFAYLGYRRGDFPWAERAADQSLALPIFPELTDEEVDLVGKTIFSFFQC